MLLVRHKKTANLVESLELTLIQILVKLQLLIYIIKQMRILEKLALYLYVLHYQY
jgi:hypothetical protein